MPVQNKSDLENVCREIANAFQGVLSWKWDDRFEAVLAEFGVENKDSIRAILESYLSFVWDSPNIGNVPDSVGMINNYFGGLMSGQLLFTSDPNHDVFIFGAWWPWGNEETISIRIGPFDKLLSESERAELIHLFQGWFGI
ncbi:hypothetical protein ACFL0M_15985 [Thermodesulfobacteriota bacterium]